LNISEQKIRELTIEVLREYGDNISPEKLREEVYRRIQSMVEKPSVTHNSMDSGRVIITSYGINKPGVVSKISTILAESNCDIQDITQKILQEFFTMIMIVDISASPLSFKELHDLLAKAAEELNIKIMIQHEDVFRSMHRI
jgi:ACT domain-containing protein